MKCWVFLVGGFLSGILARRTKLKIEHSPKISSKRRLVFALIGGILFGFGSQLGRGCTSGSALSGMAIFVARWIYFDDGNIWDSFCPCIFLRKIGFNN